MQRIRAGQRPRPKSCTPGAGYEHAFLKDYRVEVWKAKAFAIHSKVETFSLDTFGPLLHKKLRLTWREEGRTIVV